IEKLVERCSTIDEANATGHIRSKTSERVASGQCGQAASGEISFRSEADAFKAHAKVPAKEIFHVSTATPRVVPGEQLVLANLTDINALVRIEVPWLSCDVRDSNDAKKCVDRLI